MKEHCFRQNGTDGIVFTTMKETITTIEGQKVLFLDQDRFKIPVSSENELAAYLSTQEMRETEKD